MSTLSQTVGKQLYQNLPTKYRDTIFVRMISFMKIPMLYFVSPTVTEISDAHCVIKIPFLKRNRNHLNSMYFAVLAAGADCAGGLIAMKAIYQSGKDVALIFKDFKADFLKRAEGDTYFHCNEGAEVLALVQKAIETGTRVEMPVNIVAKVPSKTGDEPVAKFVVTLSLKYKK